MPHLINSFHYLFKEPFTACTFPHPITALRLLYSPDQLRLSALFHFIAFLRLLPLACLFLLHKYLTPIQGIVWLLTH